MVYIIVTVLLFTGMWVYTKLANKYLIFDKPNERSSHTVSTIRGGGIVFLLSIAFAIIEHKTLYWLPICGAVAIGVISFLDDNLNVSKRIRLLVHLFSITLLFAFLSIFTIFKVWQIAALYILFAGIINAYNFMDGINGITGIYSLILLGGVQYVNLYQFKFIEEDLIWFPMLACLVFLYHNFRHKAKVFAGDVGSITMAFWIVFLILDLMIKSKNPVYILFLTLYGVDTVLTIIHRIILKQNILEPHRLHFYQILANDKKVPHLVVSSMYAVLQLLIIVFIVSTQLNFASVTILCTLPFVMLYIVLKPKFMSSPVPPVGSFIQRPEKAKVVDVN